MADTNDCEIGFMGQISNWRMKEMCDNCPFDKHGAGLRLRRSLSRGRWQEILFSLRTNQNFICHKTTDETGDGQNLICAGSLDWQEKRGYSGNLARIMERLDYRRESAQRKGVR